MIEITIPPREFYSDQTNEFYEFKGATLTMEHSLVSLQKWEARWNKPFLSTKLSYEESIDYFKCMTLNKNVDPYAYKSMTEQNIKALNDYIYRKMTPTVFTNEQKSRLNDQFITAEDIYSWMFELQMPLECEKWHLNRLIDQIKVCMLDRQPKKKMSKKDTTAMYARINAERRKKFNTKG